MKAAHASERQPDAVQEPASRRPSRAALATVVGATLVCFAANSLLCRAALAGGRMDPLVFTLLRLASGVVSMALLVHARRSTRGERDAPRAGHWTAATALAGYALLFSWSYVRIPAGVGALVLFAAVQLTMLAAAVRGGTGPRGLGWVGVALALAGLAALTLPGSEAPDLFGVALMAGSGVGWGLYSLLGRRVRRPVLATAGNFNRALLLLAPLGIAALIWGRFRADAAGVGLATASGALASGLGYVLWYRALPFLGAVRAAVLQLAVPVIAALGGIAILGERPSARLALSSAAILGGIALVLLAHRREGAEAR